MTLVEVKLKSSNLANKILSIVKRKINLKTMRIMLVRSFDNMEELVDSNKHKNKAEVAEPIIIFTNNI